MANVEGHEVGATENHYETRHELIYSQYSSYFTSVFFI